VRTVVDALGREVRLGAPPRRIVSLVPSETETVAVLAGMERLVGRTDFCVEPAASVGAVPSVGGTKDFSVARILDLAPDLVLANQEENVRGSVMKLLAAGVPVHVSFPKTVADGVTYLESMCALLEVDPEDVAPLDELRHLVAQPRPVARQRVCVPIWRDPWMTFDERTFASDVLRWAGADNAFADRSRKYPLAADLGAADAADPGDRDTRYPRMTLEELRGRRPDVILLPDEPYAFGAEHADEIRRAFGAQPVRVLAVDGKDLFWYGVRVPGAVARVRALLASA
jgi:ABC-type Fe3+-hydroxamate transport system substrate-binding protein